MTNYIEFEGKNLEKALEKASQELLQDVGSLKYDVVSHGSSGIFGLVGVKKAKIRVQIQNNAVPVDVAIASKLETQTVPKIIFQDKPDPVKAETIEVAGMADETLEKAINAGTEALTRLVRVISDDAEITVESREDSVLFKIDGGNSAILIGKRGQTLEAIQYLVEKIVNKQNSSRIRVLVDVKGYLGARKTSLKKLASKMAEKAQKTNKPVTVGQMNAYDRRIVHMSLKDNPEVRTQSMGEGYYRKLVIFPKKRRGRKSPEVSE